MWLVLGAVVPIVIAWIPIVSFVVTFVMMVYEVYYLIIVHRIFAQQQCRNPNTYVILSIFFPFLTTIFLFSLRNNLPPRSLETPYSSGSGEGTPDITVPEA